MAGPPLRLRHRESHTEPIYSITFNRVDASLADVFATVGANRVTIYRLVEARPPAVEAEGERPQVPGKKRGHSSTNTEQTVVELETLQVYSDADAGERFYCSAWGIGQAGDSSTTSLLAVAGARCHIKLIDCCAGRPCTILPGHGGAINDLTFHPHEREWLLSASADESIRLWHVGSAECLAIFNGDAGHRDAVISLDVRFDGRCFATGSIDGSIKVWPLETDALALRAAQAAMAVRANASAAEADAAGAGTAGADTAEAADTAHANGRGQAVDNGNGAAKASDGAANANGGLSGNGAACGLNGDGAACDGTREGGGGGDGANGDGGTGVCEGGGHGSTSAPPHPPPRYPPAHCKPPVLFQRPLATYERVHRDEGSGLSQWVDCVRYIGRRLLSRGSDGRAILWQPADDPCALLSTLHPPHLHPPPSTASTTAATTAASTAAIAAASTAATPAWASASYRVLESFAVAANRGIWFLRFGLNHSCTCLAMGSTKGNVLLWDLAQIISSKPALDAASKLSSANKPSKRASKQMEPSVQVEGSKAVGGSPSSHVRSRQVTSGHVKSKAVDEAEATEEEAEATEGSKHDAAEVAAQAEHGCPVFTTLRVDPAPSSKRGKSAAKSAAKFTALTVRCAAWAAEGAYVVGGCDDGSICVWGGI